MRSLHHQQYRALMVGAYRAKRMATGLHISHCIPAIQPGSLEGMSYTPLHQVSTYTLSNDCLGITYACNH